MGKVDVIYESRRKAKEARLEIVAELYAKGKSYSKIRTAVMERLGLETYSKATVEKDVKTLLKEWREARLEDTDEAVTLFLERNRQHYEEAREEWERSREKASLVSVKEKGLNLKRKKEADGEDTGKPKRKIGFETASSAASVDAKAEKPEGPADPENNQPEFIPITKETKTTDVLPEGDPRYMDLMIKLEEQRAKILGLYAPEKQEITGRDGVPLFPTFADLDLSKLTDEEKAQLLEIARKAGA